MNSGGQATETGAGWDHRPRLLLFLAPFQTSGLGPVAATLARMAREAGHVFDLYFDAYHLGTHFGGGGDPARMPEGSLTGGSVVHGRHFESLRFLLDHFDARAVILGDSILRPELEARGVPLLVRTSRLPDLYARTAEALGLPLPRTIVLVGERGGVDAYAWPAIVATASLGVPLSRREEFADALDVRGLFLTEAEEAESGAGASLLRIEPSEPYGSITRRLAEPYRAECGGWMMADPVCALHAIPRAVEDRLLPLYNDPLTDVMAFLAEHRESGHAVVYGRQSGDEDFFALSRAGRCLQVIDPNRPPFQSVRHVTRRIVPFRRGLLREAEPSDATLEGWAEDGRVLTSVVFWTGAIREVENLYALTELSAKHRLRCGWAVCGQSPETLPHAPFSLIGAPVDRGGVGGLVELLIGSAGTGIAIEAEMPAEVLTASLQEGLDALAERIDDPDLLPIGWWVTMDAHLTPRAAAAPIRFDAEPPWFRIRYTKRRGAAAGGAGDTGGGERVVRGVSLAKRIKAGLERQGLDRLFEPWRPFEHQAPGAMADHIAGCGKAAGLAYLLTKSGFAPGLPRVMDRDGDWVALNYTTGQWDGWTPFETINSVRDLVRSERKLLARRRPGWLVGTVDSCLWTFGGHLFERIGELNRIAGFLADGGRSGRLINVLPRTLARYARLISADHP